MVTETEPNVTVEVEAPAVEAPAPSTEETSIAPPDVTQEPLPESESESDAISFDDYLSSNEDHRSAYDLRLTEAKEEGRRQAQSDLQPKYDKMRETINEYHKQGQQITQGFNQMLSEMNRLLDGQLVQADGSLDLRAIAPILNASPSAWQAFDRLTSAAGWFDAQRQLAGLFSQQMGDGGAKYLGDTITRLNNAQGGADDAGAVVKDMVQSFIDYHVEKAVTPYRNRVKSLEAQIEKGKAATREGQGPSAAGSLPGGGAKFYSQMTREERAALTPQERDALIAREIAAQGG